MGFPAEAWIASKRSSSILGLKERALVEIIDSKFLWAVGRHSGGRLDQRGGSGTSHSSVSSLTSVSFRYSFSEVMRRSLGLVPAFISSLFHRSLFRYFCRQEKEPLRCILDRQRISGFSLS